MGRLLKKKSGQATNSSEQVELKEKSMESQNLKPKLENRPLTRASDRSKEAQAEATSTKALKKRKRVEEVNQNVGKKATSECQNLQGGNEEKKVIGSNSGNSNKRNESSGTRLGGMIFMCNTKTKPDCFRYSVMGVSANKQGVVMGIKPGLKLFLFDIDLKLMYGIYEASSTGGMKLEPTAFGGGFPAQVRFKVYKDSVPIHEGVFRKAMKDIYNEKTHKFDTELTDEQVRRLLDLFRPDPWSHVNPKSSGEEMVPAPVVQPSLISNLTREETRNEWVHGRKESSKPSRHHDQHAAHAHAHAPRSLFLSEREYRSNGLQSERPFLPTSGVSFSSRVSEKFRPYDEPTRVSSQPGHALPFLNENEYKAYGLKGYQQPLSRITSSENNQTEFDPYDDSTTSLVNRYLSLPSTLPIFSDANHLHARGSYTDYSLSAPGNSILVPGRRDHLGPATIEERTLHSPYYASGGSQHYHHLEAAPNLTSSAVSSRYSFAGPSVLRR